MSYLKLNVFCLVSGLVNIRLFNYYETHLLLYFLKTWKSLRVLKIKNIVSYHDVVVIPIRYT